jgi:hypothetical protein
LFIKKSPFLNTGRCYEERYNKRMAERNDFALKKQALRRSRESYEGQGGVLIRLQEAM